MSNHIPLLKNSKNILLFIGDTWIWRLYVTYKFKGYSSDCTGENKLLRIPLKLWHIVRVLIGIQKKRMVISMSFSKCFKSKCQNHTIQPMWHFSLYFCNLKCYIVQTINSECLKRKNNSPPFSRKSEQLYFFYPYTILNTYLWPFESNL